MSALFAKLIAVALVSMSPIGEELVSIPLGVGLGLNAMLVAVVAVIFNCLPALVISWLFWRAERGTRVVRIVLSLRPPVLRLAATWILRRRSGRLTTIVKRWGIWGVIIITPWAGVYATTVALETLGMPRRALLVSIVVSLALHGAIIAIASVGLFQWLWP